MADPVVTVTPSAPLAAPVAPPAPPTAPPVVARNVLPEGLKVDLRHDAGDHYAKFEAERKASVAAAPAPVVAPVEAKVDPVPEPKPGIADRLQRKVAAPIEPKVDAKPVPDALPEDKLNFESPDSKKSAQWKELHGITKGLRDQLIQAGEREARIKSDLETARSATNAAELEQLKKDNEAMSKRLMVVNLQEHPKFHSEFIAPRDQALANAQELLAANEIKDVQVSALLDKPRSEFGKAVSEVAKGLSSFDQTEFAEAMRKAYALKQQSDQALAKSKDVYQALRSQTDGLHKKAFEEVANRALANIGEHAVELEVTDPKNEEAVRLVNSYNNDFKAIRANAEKLALGATTPQAVAEAAFMAEAYKFHIKHVQPALLSDYNQLRQINAGLIAEIQAMRSTNPKRQIRGASAPGDGGVDPYKMDAHQAAEFFHGKKE